ncbi:MAG: cupin domain-containing protein [Candidatus Velthaea sp.]
MRRISLVTAIACAFIAGFCCARSLPVVHAASAPLTAQIIDVSALAPADLGDLRPNTANFHAKTFVTADGATIAVQSGDTGKHYHADANEVQYVLEGTGKFWLGDTYRDVKPGDLIVIPKGTAHAGSRATAGTFKTIAFKTPPQAADDVHPLP